MASTQPERRRRPAARPDEILDAALAVFTERGFSAARMDEVAARAGLSKGAVYLYFDSKQAVFEAIVQRFAARIAGAVAGRAEELAAADPEDALRRLFRHLLTVTADPAASAVPRLMLAEAPRFPAVAALYRREVIAQGQRAIDAILAAGVGQGVFRPADGGATLRSVIGPVLAHMLLTQVFAAQETERETTPLETEAMADALADTLLLGLKVRKEAP